MSFTSKVDKSQLLAVLIESLEKDIAVTLEAARVAHEAATNEESKPENEYDTRALEASYLAGAQAKRAADLDETLASFRTMKMKNFSTDEQIASTALVKLGMKSKGKTSWVLLMPAGGGVHVSFENQTIQVITPTSTLGEALLGLKVGDIAEVEVGAAIKEFEVLQVF